MSTCKEERPSRRQEGTGLSLRRFYARALSLDTAHMCTQVKSARCLITEDLRVQDLLYMLMTLAFFAASVTLLYTVDRLNGGPKP